MKESNNAPASANASWSLRYNCKFNLKEKHVQVTVAASKTWHHDPFL